MRKNIYECLIAFVLLVSLFSCSKHTKESVGVFNGCCVIATKDVTASGDTVIVCDLSLIHI